MLLSWGFPAPPDLETNTVINPFSLMRPLLPRSAPTSTLCCLVPWSLLCLLHLQPALVQAGRRALAPSHHTEVHLAGFTVQVMSSRNKVAVLRQQTHFKGLCNVAPAMCHQEGPFRSVTHPAEHPHLSQLPIHTFDLLLRNFLAQGWMDLCHAVFMCLGVTDQADQ